MLKKLGGYRRNAWVDIAGICISVLYKVMTRSYKVYAKLTKGCLLTYKGLLASIQGIYRGDV